MLYLYLFAALNVLIPVCLSTKLSTALSYRKLILKLRLLGFSILLGTWCPAIRDPLSSFDTINNAIKKKQVLLVLHEIILMPYKKFLTIKLNTIWLKIMNTLLIFSSTLMDSYYYHIVIRILMSLVD